MKRIGLLLLFTFLSLSPSRGDSGKSDAPLQTMTYQGHSFVPLQELAKRLSAPTYYSNKVKKAILYVGSKEVKVTASNPFVLIEEDVYQLPMDTRYDGEDIWVPLMPFLDILRPLYGGRLRFSEEHRSIEVNPASFNIVGINVEEKFNGTLIRIATTKRFDPSSVRTRLSQGWLYVDIYGGKVDTTKPPEFRDQSIVRRLVPIQFPQMAQLSFQLREDVSRRKVFVQDDAQEIWVSLQKETASLSKLEDERRKWRIDKIIIDPGHGGQDPGAIGPSGVREKDVTLEIAKRLKHFIEKRLKLQVMMTRNDDRFVPLKERTSFANREGGKLFISIHANSNHSKHVDGFTTYFLGPAKTEEALEVARRENEAIQYEDETSGYADLSDENFILVAMAQNAFNKESQDLAAMVQEELERAVPLTNRGVKQAGYYVLIGASMPNILVETAFISNPKEERLLKSGSFQEKIAEALCESLRRFKERCEVGI